VQTLRSFGWRQWLVVFLFVLVLGATAWHTTRTVRHAIYWQQHRDEPIRGWMTVGYVAHSYHVPARVLYQALNLPPREPREPRDRRTLRVIARAQGRTLEEISVVLQDAITRARTSPAQTPPPPPPHDDGGKP
jgi:hypothetical protein